MASAEPSLEEQVTLRSQELLRKAGKSLGLKFPEVKIMFSLTGISAGIAGYHKAHRLLINYNRELK